MAKRKSKMEVGNPDLQQLIDFGFFQKEVEQDGVSAMRGHEIGDPNPNFTGSLNLDFDLTTPFPEGRIIEIFGPNGTCKTTLLLSVLGEAIKRGKIGLYVNMEKNLNLSLMRTVRSLRPYLDEAIAAMKAGKQGECPLWIINASNGEQALEAMRKFASMVPNGIAGLDSIDAAQPEAVLSGVIGESKVGNLAKLMSDAMRKLIDASSQNKVSLVFINQIRDKITMYGDPTTTPGGNAVGFYASQRIQLFKPRKQEIITDADGERIGVLIRYKIVKNKVAPDGDEGAFPILFKNGIFREHELVTRCCEFGVLKMGGKGGKQAYLPSIDRATGEYVLIDGERKETCMTQFNAARRLLMDSQLTEKLEAELAGMIDGGHHAVDAFLDEIQEPQ